MAGVKDRASRSDAAPRPHIVVLMCDQMHASRMGFVDGIAHTPTLDRLAAEGFPPAFPPTTRLSEETCEH